MRTDLTLVPPIRQTASIFKQPVTVYKPNETTVKSDVKHGSQEKPKQLFWEKRLEVMKFILNQIYVVSQSNDNTVLKKKNLVFLYQGLRACDVDGIEFGPIELPKGLKAVGPNVDEGTLLQSVATALHVSGQPIIGQTEQKSVLTSNLSAFTNPEQPLMYAINISDDDIRRQEERVTNARKKLQDALKD